MRARPSRFLLPAVVVAGAALAFGSSASDTSDGERSARAAPSGEHQLGRDAGASERPDPRSQPAARDQRPTPAARGAPRARRVPERLAARPAGRIDPVRYPGFAALAADATWFRNAYSVYDSTTKAVPLILDGMRPRRGSAADSRYHPRSIFTSLARARLPHRELRGGHRDLPAAALPRGAGAAAGDPAAPGPRARGALRRFSATAAPEPPAHPLDAPRAAPARALSLPALRRPHALARARPACRA